jgi:hypothetical protein
MQRSSEASKRWIWQRCLTTVFAAARALLSYRGTGNSCAYGTVHATSYLFRCCMCVHCRATPATGTRCQALHSGRAHTRCTAAALTGVKRGLQLVSLRWYWLHGLCRELYEGMQL